MALTRDFRETVQADAKRDPAYRKGLLSEAMESLLSGEVALGKELLRDYINATIGFPKLAGHTKIHVKTLHQMLGPSGNPTASNLFEIIACLQRAEGVRFEVRSRRATLHEKKDPLMRGTNHAGRSQVMQALVGISKHRKDLLDSTTYVRRLRKGKRLRRIAS
jgi:hypothetical protein